jgi:hypothetical protein
VPIRPFQDLQPAIFVLDESRAAFDPAAVIAVQNCVDRVNFGANDATDVAPACFGDEGVLMVADRVDRVLDLVLAIGLQRLVRKSKLAAAVC